MLNLFQHPILQVQLYLSNWIPKQVLQDKKSKTVNPEITIRKVKPEEAEELAKFSANLFAETFAASNSPEDMELYLTESFSVEKIRIELTDPNISSFYAIKNSIPIGCIKLILNQTNASFTGIKTAEISRLYVDKTYHNQKIGATLMQFAIDFAIRNQAQKLILGVWEHNQKAINFYHKWGFVKIGVHDFQLGNDLQQDWLMEKNLN